MTRHVLTLGTATYDPRDMSLTGPGGAPVALSNKAREVLACLVDAQGDAVAKETLVNSVWPEVPVEPTTVPRVIAELRDAIGDDDKTILQSLPRFGFQLQGTWAEVPDDAPPPGKRRGLAVVAVVIAMLILGTLVARLTG